VKSLYYSANGEPWDVVCVRDEPAPVLQPGQVLVSLEAAPLHIADLMVMRGELAMIPPGPGTPGFEGVGRIARCAPDVVGWTVGERVLLPIAHGACREQQAHDPASLMRVPDGVAAEQLALVRVNLTTAWVLLHAFETLEPGSWVIQNAANSNVGGYVAGLARRAGLKLIEVVRRPELVGMLEADGRGPVLVDGPGLRDEVARLGVRPRLALDAVGGAATARLGSVVADRGLVLSYGFLSKEPHQLDFPDLIYRDVRLRGMLTNYPLESMDAAAHARMDADLQRFIGEGELRADIAGIYPFSRAADALRHAAETGPARAGKVILVPS
jgi:NADPH:quinone reductase-like Zn-dependent oxidoreductase